MKAPVDPELSAIIARRPTWTAERIAAERIKACDPAAVYEWAKLGLATFVEDAQRHMRLSTERTARKTGSFDYHYEGVPMAEIIANPDVVMDWSRPDMVRLSTSIRQHHGDGAFRSWQRRALEVAEARDASLAALGRELVGACKTHKEIILGLWDETEPQFIALRDERKAAEQARLARIYDEVLGRAKQLTFDPTPHLLASAFMVDGRRVTWATASVDDHRQRIDALVRHADGVLETAALHQAAILHLAKTEAETLGSAA